MEALECTGIYVRAKVHGENYDTRDIADLTIEEKQEALKGKTPEELIQWIDALCGMLRSENMVRRVA